MANFGQVAERIKSIDIGKIFVDFATRNEDSIVGLVRSQLYQGETGEGKLHPAYYGASYSSGYVDEKESMNPRPGYGQPDLYYTGGFYEGMYIQEAKETHAKVWSTDRKTNALVLDGWAVPWHPGDWHPEYGLEVFELNEESLQQLRFVFLRTLNQTIRETLKSK